jgi:hypothetical protein
MIGYLIITILLIWYFKCVHKEYKIKKGEKLNEKSVEENKDKA